MQPGEVIGRGRTADIYSFGPWALKWLHPEFFSREALFNEVQKTLAANDAGVSAPRLLAVLEHRGRPGLLFERMSGPSMLNVVMGKWWQAAQLGRQLAALHASLHAAAAPGLGSMHDRLGWAIRHAPRLRPELKSAALDLLARLPDGEALCHGDFHPGNVVFHHGEAMVLDWVDACRGNPLADVARTQMLFEIPRLPLPPLVAAFINRLRAYMLRAYLDEYFKLRPGGREQLDDWLTVIMAARLAERADGEEEILLQKLQRLG
ncbi:MAG: phosphotransferase [Anaerolineales bacterium]|nr:phosphotransferase [Anaerolineales bacterium]